MRVSPEIDIYGNPTGITALILSEDERKALVGILSCGENCLKTDYFYGLMPCEMHGNYASLHDDESLDERVIRNDRREELLSDILYELAEEEELVYKSNLCPE